MYTLYGTDGSGSCMIEIALQRCAVPWHRVERRLLGMERGQR